MSFYKSLLSLYKNNYKEEDDTNYFWIRNIDSNEDTITIKRGNEFSIDYSFDKQKWSTIDSTEKEVNIPLPPKKTVFLKGKLQSSSITRIYSSYRFYVGGELTTLSNNSNSFNCTELFHGTKVVDASELILPKVISYSEQYFMMFRLCKDLLYPPKEIQASETTFRCCYEMFSGCSRLKTCPEIKAGQVVENNAFNMMFYNCTSLTTAPQEITVDTLGSWSCKEMFYGCTSLKTPMKINTTTVDSYACQGMYYNCTSLIETPELPATNISSYCYEKMFYGCSKLLDVPELPAETLGSNCYNSMFYGCTSITGRIVLPAKRTASSCYKDMFNGCINFNGCTIQATTTGQNESMINMFYGCTSLNYLRVSFSTIGYYGSNKHDTDNWVYNCNSSGEMYCPNGSGSNFPVSDWQRPKNFTLKYF